MDHFCGIENWGENPLDPLSNIVAGEGAVYGTFE